MMKIEKLKENSIDEILSFASENKNLVIGNNNTFSNDFKNLLTRFAASRNKVNSELLCYALRNDNRELVAAMVFNAVIDTYKIPSLTAKVNDENIGKFNEIGFKSVLFNSTMDDANTYTNYYFLIRYSFPKTKE